MNKGKIKIKPLLHFLEEIHLGGVLNECLINIKKGKGKVNAVDITNSVIIAGRKKIFSKDINADLGIGNMEFLIKFLAAAQDERISFELRDNYLRFITKSKSSKKTLDYLLTQPDLIATRFDLLKSKKDKGQSPIIKILDSLEYSTDLSSQFIKDHCSYMTLLKNQTKNENVTISFNEDGEIKFVYGEKNSHMLKLSLESEIEEGEDFEVKINGENLSRIFMSIKFSQEDPPSISFSEDKPVVVQSNSIGWALVPIMAEV